MEGLALVSRRKLLWRPDCPCCTPASGAEHPPAPAGRTGLSWGVGGEEAAPCAHPHRLPPNPWTRYDSKPVGQGTHQIEEAHIGSRDSKGRRGVRDLRSWWILSQGREAPRSGCHRHPAAWLMRADAQFRALAGCGIQAFLPREGWALASNLPYPIFPHPHHSWGVLPFHTPSPTCVRIQACMPCPILSLGYEGTTTGTWSLRPNLRAQCGNGVHWQLSHPKWPRPPSSACDVHLARLILKPQQGGGSSVHSPWNTGSHRVWEALWGRGRGGRTFCSFQASMRAGPVYLLHIWDIDVRPALKNCSAKNEQTSVPQSMCPYGHACIRCAHTRVQMYVRYGRVRMVARN